jgi:proline iminopeptidase
MDILKRILKTIMLLVAVAVIIIIGLYFATDTDNTVPDTVATDSTIPHIEIDGVVFHAETFGDPANPVVVVVHGGPGGDYGYLLNLHRLEDDYFVVFYDQRGAGLSPRVAASELTLQSSIDDLHRIVTHYGNGEPVNLIGHSWGGMLAAGYIGQYSEYVDKVVLAEPGALDNAGLARFNERQSTQGFAYYRTLVPTIFETFHMTQPDPDALMDYIFGQMMESFVNSSASGYRCAGENVKAITPDVPVPQTRIGSTAFSTLFGPDADLMPIADNAANYTGVVLFVASECSSFSGVDFQREQMAIFPQARLVVISNAGHEMFSENPTDSLAVLRDYFDP